MKDQALNGSDLADRVERLTGERPNAMRVSRWTNPYGSGRPLIRISPDLAVVAAALNLDPVELICDAVRQAHDVEQGAVTPNLHQSSRCEHPNVAGEGCQACCDDCNSDRHQCFGCGTPVGHRTHRCPDCTDDER
jgi:hypothetical protein